MNLIEYFRFHLISWTVRNPSEHFIQTTTVEYNHLQFRKQFKRLSIQETVDTGGVIKSGNNKIRTCDLYNVNVAL